MVPEDPIVVDILEV